jgi:hypothetical protein
MHSNDAATATADRTPHSSAALFGLRSTGLDVSIFPANFHFVMRILDCDHLDRGECPGDWEKLPLAGETDIRVCPMCLKAVYRCSSAEEAQLRQAAGHRAAVAN